nr:hypothetical protein [Tanacetum cinerariifolium]
MRPSKLRDEEWSDGGFGWRLMEVVAGMMMVRLEMMVTRWWWLGCEIKVVAAVRWLRWQWWLRWEMELTMLVVSKVVRGVVEMVTATVAGVGGAAPKKRKEEGGSRGGFGLEMMTLVCRGDGSGGEMKVVAAVRWPQWQWWLRWEMEVTMLVVSRLCVVWWRW